MNVTQGFPPIPEAEIPSLLSQFGVNLITVIKPSLTILMVQLPFMAILIPLIFALFWFSTAELRRKPIFILNVVAILLCLTYGALSSSLQVRQRVGMHVSSPGLTHLLVTGTHYNRPFTSLA